MDVMDNQLANGSAAGPLTAAADGIDSASAREPNRAAGEVRYWRAALESRWTVALEAVIVLSRACHEARQSGADGTADPGGASLTRLMGRTERAYQDLADIGAAIEKLDAGSFGICDRCEGPMPPDWLDDEPQVPHCPDCSLQMVRWRPTPIKTAVRRTRPSTGEPKSTSTLKSAGPLTSEVPASAARRPSHHERQLSVVAS
jgi:DnaK suppressor protein